MRKRANPALIGGFVVGAGALLVIGVLLLGGRFLTERRTYVLYFEDSEEGLSVGAPVTFQGVRIGAVSDIQVQYLPREGEFRVPVFIDIEPGRVKEVGVGDGRRGEEPLIRSLIERGLRAQLRTQSPVTGQLSVRLGFHPDTPVRLVGGEGKVPEIPTIPTVFAHRLGTVQGLDRLVNAPELCAILRSLDHTLTTLQQLLSRVDGRVTPLADGVEKTLGTARATLRDGQQLLRHVDGRVARPADGLEDTSKVAQATLVQAQRRLDDPLQGVTAAARAIRLLADYLERNPNALLFGKGGDRR